MSEYKYYAAIVGTRVYRTKDITFSDGTPSVLLEKWNWDWDNWNGHIHNHELTRLMIKEGLRIVQITEEQLNSIIK
jgi:hypothetical protein